jgi:hypothetical protein
VEVTARMNRWNLMFLFALGLIVGSGAAVFAMSRPRGERAPLATRAAARVQPTLMVGAILVAVTATALLWVAELPTVDRAMLIAPLVPVVSTIIPQWARRIESRTIASLSAGTVLMLFCIISGFSIGLLYVPAAAFLIAAAAAGVGQLGAILAREAQIRRLSAVGVLLLLLGACRTASPPPNTTIDPTPAAAASETSPPLGAKENPVQSNGPFGEREYLQRLRCADGTAPAFSRNGSVGSGADRHVLDSYSVKCPGNEPAHEVFMDMYHNHRERRAISGFTVLPELPARLATGCPPQVVPSADSSARYIFNFLEVEKPAAPIKPLPTEPISVGARGYMTIGFVIDTTGRPEPASIRFRDPPAANMKAVADSIMEDLRFTPAEHHAGCRVRQGTSIQLTFR